jgi:hypothetical protein
MPKFFAHQIMQNRAPTFARTAAGLGGTISYSRQPRFCHTATITAAHGVPVRVANNANTEYFPRVELLAFKLG